MLVAALHVLSCSSFHLFRLGPCTTQTGPGAVTCSRGVKLVPDTSLEAALKGAPGEGAVADAVLLPGGAGGAAKLRQSEVCGERLQVSVSVLTHTLVGRTHCYSLPLVAWPCFNKLAVDTSWPALGCDHGLVVALRLAWMSCAASSLECERDVVS